MPRDYILTQNAEDCLRTQKKWSLDHFGRAATKKYFQDLEKGFRYIAENYERFPSRPSLTGNTGLWVYPIREHYVTFLPVQDAIYIVAIFGKAQDVLTILEENAAIFFHAIAIPLELSDKQKKAKGRSAKKKTKQ